MAHAKTVRGSTIRCALLLLPLLAGFACSRQEEFDKLFREKLAKRALACFHPLGEIKTAGPIKIGGEGFRGTIYWQGGFPATTTRPGSRRRSEPRSQRST